MNSTMKLTMDLSALLAEVKETACIKNVHDPLYLSNQKIINRLESISGHKFKKTTKREVIVNFIEGMVNNLTNNGYAPERKEEIEMNTNTTIITAAENCDGDSLIRIKLSGLLMDIRSSESIKNVHSEDYMSKQLIIDRFESITGEIMSDKKTRAQLIQCVQNSFEYYDDIVNPGNYPENHCDPDAEYEEECIVQEYENAGQEALALESQSEDFRAEVLSEMDLANEAKIIEKQNIQQLQNAVDAGFAVKGNTKALYNKEETSEIGTKIMAKILVSALKIAKANWVKSFISDKMLDKVIDNCLFGVPFDADYKQRCYAITKEQTVKASQVKKAVVARTMLVYKEGYIVKPYYMAWTYKNTILTYRTTAPGAATIYELDIDNKIIINTKTKKSVALDKANCEYLNNMLLIGMNKSK